MENGAAGKQTIGIPSKRIPVPSPDYHENENIQKIFHAQQLYASSNFDAVHQNLLVSSHNISSSRTGIICDTQKLFFSICDPNILVSNMSAKDKFLPVKN